MSLCVLCELSVNCIHNLINKIAFNIFIIMERKSKNITKEDWDAVDSPAISVKMLSRMKPVKESHPDIPARVRGPQKLP